MRVLLLCNSYPPEIGAAPWRMQGLAHRLRDAGYEVAVLTGMPNYPTGRIFPEYLQASGKGAVIETIAGISVCRVPFTPSHSASRARRIGSLLSLSGAMLRHGGAFIRSFQPHWMLISSPPLPLALSGAWMARRRQIPFLLNISDLWPLTAKELGVLREGTLYGACQRAEGWLLRCAQGWMGQSDEILRYIHERSQVQKPSFLYRNLPPTLGGKQPHSLAKTGPRKMVYAGLIGPVQGILDIATQVNFAAYGLELHLYGDGMDRGAVEDFARCQPERGVVYSGLLSLEEMFDRLPEYDFALAALRKPIYGAVPSKIYAALAAGLPTVFLGGGEGAALICQHAAGWTLPAGDLAALRALLPFLRDMPAEELARLRRHILQVQQTHLSAERQGADFVQFFRRLTEGL